MLPKAPGPTGGLSLVPKIGKSPEHLKLEWYARLSSLGQVLSLDMDDATAKACPIKDP
jgi:hypothetical protein